ncbi:hypothetical protein WL48_08340 [Burkholderia ubonensis]|nr:hypothetical protein WL48_08340 [Burkholderia ubonensis]KWC29187.1 hypothetical protein WL49_29905 [Burkholderia ubonensis]
MQTYGSACVFVVATRPKQLGENVDLLHRRIGIRAAGAVQCIANIENRPLQFARQYRARFRWRLVLSDE